MSDVIIILGMHRTGTSLLARYLAESGVFMGYRLLEKHTTNPAGHFEDKDFLSFHQDLLKANNIDHKVIEPISWDISPEFRIRAQQIIEERNQYPVWGWKDPRTCLFLDFWQTLVPDASYLICYRHYLPVVKSLITRDITFYNELTNRLQRLRHPRFKKAEITEVAHNYLRVWIHYNSEILAQIERQRLRYILMPFDDLIKGSFDRLDRLHVSGILSDTPGQFAPAQSRSDSHLKLDFILDPEFIAEADAIDSRFSAILQAPVR